MGQYILIQVEIQKLDEEGRLNLELEKIIIQYHLSH